MTTCLSELSLVGEIHTHMQQETEDIKEAEKMLEEVLKDNMTTS